SIVDHLAMLVAPGRVVHLTDRHLGDIARDHSIHESRGVSPGDQVLEERRYVDERRRVSDRVVLVVVMALVRADRVVARPVAVVEALAQRGGAFVYRSEE